MEREIIEDAILTAYITLTPEQRRAFESFLDELTDTQSSAALPETPQS